MQESYSLGKLTRRRSDGTTYWSYCIKWFDEGGTRSRSSLGTTDKVAAQALAREFWAKRTAGIGGTIGALVEAYLDTLPKPYEGWRRNGVNDPVTQSRIKGAQRKREGWLQAKPFWAALSPADVDAQTSRDYMTWRAKAANTMRHELGPIYSAMAWAVGEKLSDRFKSPSFAFAPNGHIAVP